MASVEYIGMLIGLIKKQFILFSDHVSINLLSSSIFFVFIAVIMILLQVRGTGSELSEIQICCKNRTRTMGPFMTLYPFLTYPFESTRVLCVLVRKCATMCDHVQRSELYA